MNGRLSALMGAVQGAVAVSELSQVIDGKGVPNPVVEHSFFLSVFFFFLSKKDKGG